MSAYDDVIHSSDNNTTNNRLGTICSRRGIAIARVHSVHAVAADSQNELNEFSCHVRPPVCRQRSLISQYIFTQGRWSLAGLVRTSSVQHVTRHISALPSLRLHCSLPNRWYVSINSLSLSDRFWRHQQLTYIRWLHFFYVAFYWAETSV